MATSDTRHPVDSSVHFCAQCGHEVGDGSFCSSCGAPITRDAADDRVGRFVPPVAGLDAAERLTQETQPLYSHAEAPTQVAPPTMPPRPDSGAPAAAGWKRRRAWIFGAIGLVVLLLGGVAAALILSSSSSGGSTADVTFRQRVATVFSPVLNANRNLSSELGGVHGAHPTSAQRATSDAQDTTNSAAGALTELSVPNGSQQLARMAREALDRESTYLLAVSVALRHPANPGVSQLQSLAGNVSSALDAIGSPMAGAGKSVSGADTLTTWAQRRARTASSSSVRQVPAPAPAATVNCGQFQTTDPDGNSFIANDITVSNVSCDTARAMISSGAQGRGQQGWNCPLTGNSSYTSCTQGAQTVAWAIEPAPASSGSSSDCASFAAHNPDGSGFLASNISLSGVSCNEARGMIDAGPRGRVRRGWDCPLTGDPTHTSCTRGDQSVAWDIQDG